MPPKVSASIKHFLAKEATVGFLDFCLLCAKRRRKVGTRIYRGIHN